MSDQIVVGFTGEDTADQVLNKLTALQQDHLEEIASPVLRRTRLLVAEGDPKENVIIGKLIPASTGLDRYNNITVEPTEEAKTNLFTGPSAFSDCDYAGVEGGLSPEFHAIPLDDYDVGSDFR